MKKFISKTKKSPFWRPEKAVFVVPKKSPFRGGLKNRFFGAEKVAIS
jgi:hypothetical protein